MQPSHTFKVMQKENAEDSAKQREKSPTQLDKNKNLNQLQYTLTKYFQQARRGLEWTRIKRVFRPEPSQFKHDCLMPKPHKCDVKEVKMIPGRLPYHPALIPPNGRVPAYTPPIFQAQYQDDEDLLKQLNIIPRTYSNKGKFHRSNGTTIDDRPVQYLCTPRKCCSFCGKFHLNKKEEHLRLVEHDILGVEYPLFEVEPKEGYRSMATTLRKWPLLSDGHRRSTAFTKSTDPTLKQNKDNIAQSLTIMATPPPPYEEQHLTKFSTAKKSTMDNINKLLYVEIPIPDFNRKPSRSSSATSPLLQSQTTIPQSSQTYRGTPPPPYEEHQNVVYGYSSNNDSFFF